MDEALQNVTDYIDTEGQPLSRRDWVDMLKAIKSYCDLCIEADEDFDGDDEDEDDEDE